MRGISKSIKTCLLAFLLVFAGIFASAAAENTLDQETMVTVVESILSELETLDEETLNSAITTYEAYGEKEMAAGFNGYLQLKDSLGTFQSVSDPAFVLNDDGSSSISATVAYENKTVEVTLYYSTSGLTGFTFEEKASLGSLMKEAAGNLVVGMGTVFLVLIFLCWIISLFKNISVLENRMKNRKTADDKTKPQEPARNREVLELVPQEDASTEEIQAVIAAAIAAYEADNSCSIEKQPALSNGITIKTYRRK